jgi:protein Mpv17
MNPAIAKHLFQRVQQTWRTLFSSKYLLTTNVIISVVSASAGAELHQQYELVKGHQQKWNWRRPFNYALLSGLCTPPLHYWYIMLDRVFPGRALRTILIKVALDTIIVPPSILFYFGGAIILENGFNSWELVKNKMIQSGPAIFLVDLLAYQPCMAANFYFVPTRFRILFDSIISMCSDIYYSIFIFSHGKEKYLEKK